MLYLALVSIIWAFSFGLIGEYLAQVDSFFVASARLAIPALVFAPFLRLSRINRKDAFSLIGCGALQFGIMYVAYIKAFHYIPSHLVALFSITTPLYVILLHDLRRRHWHPRLFMAAVLSVAGAALIKGFTALEGSVWIGFGLMQIAGLAFGFGQVFYRDWKQCHEEVPHHQIFGLLYLGGFAVAGLAMAAFSDLSTVRLDLEQGSVLLYLGLVASGAGFFFWNKGASQSRPGTLAAFNNAVVPLAMLSSLFVFSEVNQIEHSALIRLLLGAALIFGAVFLAEKTPRES